MRFVQHAIKVAVCCSYLHMLLFFVPYLPHKMQMSAGVLIGLSTLNQFEDYLVTAKYIAKCLCLYKATDNVVFPLLIFSLFLISDYSLLSTSNIIANTIDLYSNAVILKMMI